MTRSGRIEFEISGSVARLWLNDPATLNSLSADMVTDIRDCCREAEAKARVLVVAGRGGHFCSGANLAVGEMLTTPTPDFDAGAVLESHVNPLMLQLRDLHIPWMASVTGAAAGVGCPLALAADLVVAAETAYFLMAFRRVGLVPDGGSTFLLTRTIGRVRAMELMLLGDKLPAAQALAWGLVNRVVAPDVLDATVDDLAGRLATGPTHALASIRRAAWIAVEGDLETSLAAERRFQDAAGRTHDFAEGLAAFREKRKPRFSGT